MGARTTTRTAPTRRFIAATLAALTTLAAVAAMPTPGHAAPPEDDDPVTRWADQHAVPIRTVERPGPDLAMLRRATRDAQIVGLGEAAHRLAEVTSLKRRAVEFLVEERGFRSIAWEDDWSLGTQINDYIHGRRHDLGTLVTQMSATAWRTEEVAGTLAWLREYNRHHDDDVDFVGVEYFATRPLAYDAVEAYVAEAAPGRLAEVRGHLDLIEPCTDDMHKYLTWFRTKVDDKQTYSRRARALFDLVAEIPHRPGDREHALALHHARQIRSFYVAFSLPDDEIWAYRDARAAENLRWWQQYSGDKVVYWAAAAHTADAPDVTVTLPPGPPARFASVGSFLSDWYGDRYVTVGYTFDRGVIDVTPGRPVELPPAADAWFEAPLGDVQHEQFMLDLGRRVPAEVREWLQAPMLTRGFPEAGLASTMSGSTPADWFDVVVHRQVVSPATPLR